MSEFPAKFRMAAVAAVLAGAGFAAEVGNFNAGWWFTRQGEQPVRVNLPHDAAVGADSDPEARDFGVGALPSSGHCEYSKSFEVSDAEAATLGLCEGLSPTASWRLEFDGVSSRVRIRINGRQAAERADGRVPFAVPLDGMLRRGENTVRVTVDAPADSERGSRGWGIYRDVRLVKAPLDHVVPGSVSIVTRELSSRGATMEATWTMSVGGPQRRRFVVENPQLWTPESPRMHTVELGGERFRYCIRALRHSPTEGFSLNGRRRRLHGVRLSRDWGVFGAEFEPEAVRRRLTLLKEAGCDAIRTDDDSPAPGLLDLCDEMGLLVVDGAAYSDDGGEFALSGFGGPGEPDSGRGDSRGPRPAIFDSAGFPNDGYWRCRSEWRPQKATVRIATHWNRNPGDRVPVEVFTSGDEVELWLNGRSLGCKARAPDDGRIVWNDVAWEPGELKAVAYRDGKPWATDIRRTAGRFLRFKFTDTRYGEKYLFRQVRAVDGVGTTVPDAAVEVDVPTPDGHAVFGTSNGDPDDRRSPRSPTVVTHDGRALIVYRRL